MSKGHCSVSSFHNFTQLIDLVFQAFHFLSKFMDGGVDFAKLLMPVVAMFCLGVFSVLTAVVQFTFHFLCPLVHVAGGVGFTRLLQVFGRTVQVFNATHDLVHVRTIVRAVGATLPTTTRQLILHAFQVAGNLVDFLFDASPVIDVVCVSQLFMPSVQVLKTLM
jgi:hypothetical protein